MIAMIKSIAFVALLCIAVWLLATGFHEKDNRRSHAYSAAASAVIVVMTAMEGTYALLTGDQFWGIFNECVAVINAVQAARYWWKWRHPKPS